MADDGVFLGRVDELQRWQLVLAGARARADGQTEDGGSYVALVHGIGGMGKSRLVRRLVELTPDTRTVRRRGPPHEYRAVLIDLEAERKRVPDRYPPLEGPSVGTLLYTLERTICEQFGASAEDAFADFRAVLGQIIEVVRDSDRLRQEAQQAGAELSAEDRKGLENAAVLVGGLLGVTLSGPIVSAGIAVGGTAAKMFRGRRRTRRDSEHGDVPSVPQRRIDLALDAERVLVRAFASGVATAAGTGTLVVAIDTGEIAATALAAVRDAAVDGNSNVVWLIAGRFDSPAATGYLTSTVGEFERAIISDRLTVIAISVFDRKLQQEYLRSRQPKHPCTDEELATIDRATHGIPLGLSLVAEMLRDGLSLEILDETIDAQGEANLLIQGLAERFLHHALRQPAGTPNALRADLTAIFALIADETADSGKIIGYPLQRRIRAALLNIEPDDLRSRLDELAARHDFVLAASGQVHEEVATVVRDYMLGNDQRHRCAAMHERVIAVIGQELEARFAALCVGDRVNDEAWRLLAAAYVRHSFWISNSRGISALACVLPAAVVLRPEWAVALRTIAARFYVTATNDEQAILRGLPWPPRSSIYEPWLEQRRTVSVGAPPRLPTGGDADRARASRVLGGTALRVAGLTVDDLSNKVVSDLMAADQAEFAGRTSQQVQHTKRAHERLQREDAALSAAIATRAQNAASTLILDARGRPQNNPWGLVAAEIAAARGVDDGWDQCFYAIALEGARRPQEADAAYRRAVRGDPSEVFILSSYAHFLISSGEDHDQTQEMFERALLAEPQHTYSLSMYAWFLTSLRGEHDRAQELYERAVDIDPNDAGNLGSYAWLLTNVRGEHDRAEQLFERAVDADPRDPANLSNYALFLTTVRGEHDRAQAFYERALEADPNDAAGLGTYARFLTRVRADHDRAEELYVRMMANDPTDADHLVSYAWLLTSVRGEHDRADELFVRALDIDPMSADTLDSYAWFLTSVRGDHDRAQALYERAIEANPKDAAGLATYARFLTRVRGDHDRADEFFVRALDVDPEGADPLGSYAWFLTSVRGEHDRAEKLYQRAMEADPTDADNLGSYAWLLTSVRGEQDRAQELYERALAADPEDADNLGNYAWFLTTVRGEHDRAGELYQQALRIDPKNANNHGNFAAWHLELGENPRAIELIRAAFTLADARDDGLRAELWMYLYALGPVADREKARSELARLLVAGVRSPGWRFERIVTQAVEQGHTDERLSAVADVIGARADIATLEGWTRSE